MDKLFICLNLFIFVAGNVEIEVSFFTDKSAQNWFHTSEQSQVDEEVDYLITEVNKLYEQIGITILKKGQTTLLLTDLPQSLKPLLPHNKDPIYPENDIWTDVQTVSYAFEDYIKGRVTGDIEVLLTNRNIYSQKPRRKQPIAGTSPGIVCHDRKYAIVKIESGYMAVYTLAHELGHVLGVMGHDKEPEFIMYRELRQGQNTWSPASQKAIYNNLASVSCQNSKSDSHVPKQALPASMNTPDKICARVSATWMSHIYGSVQNDGGDKICNNLLGCAEKILGNQASNVRVYNGMICGKQKTCNNGKCVNDPSTNTGNARDGCPYGDAPKIWQGFSSGRWTSCNDLNSYERCTPNGSNYAAPYASACCETCKNGD